MFSCLQQAEERNFFTSFSRNLGFVDLPIPVLQESLSRFALAKLALSNFIQVVHEYRFKPGTERVPTRPYTCRHNTICMGRTHEIAFRGGPPLSLSLLPWRNFRDIFPYSHFAGTDCSPTAALHPRASIPLSAQLKVANEIGTELEWKYSSPRHCGWAHSMHRSTGLG